MKLSTREFLHRTIGALATGPLCFFATKVGNREAVNKQFAQYSKSGIDPEQDARINSDLQRAALRETLLNSLFVSGLGSEVNNILLARNRIHKVRKEINQQTSDPVERKLDLTARIERRDWLNILARSATMASLAGPLAADLFTSPNLERHLQEPDDNPTSQNYDHRVSAAVLKNSRERVCRTFKWGSAAAASKALREGSLDAAYDKKINEVRDLINNSREKLRRREAVYIPVWTSRPKLGYSVYFISLVDLLPPEFLQDRTEPLNLILAEDRKSLAKVAYFPNDNGDDKNWSGPGIYYRDWQGKRITKHSQILIPLKGFTLEYNEKLN